MIERGLSDLIDSMLFTIENMDVGDNCIFDSQGIPIMVKRIAKYQLLVHIGSEYQIMFVCNKVEKGANSSVKFMDYTGTCIVSACL